jgi:hypothetical protein
VGGLAESRATQQTQFEGKAPCVLYLQPWECHAHVRQQASGVRRDVSDGGDIGSRFWRSYLDLARATPPLAAQPPTEAVAVDVHCLVSLHVTVSVGFLVTSMDRIGENYERIVQRVETVFQGLKKG